MTRIIVAEARFRPEFYDLDPMNIVWHGNYVKYFELGRCALLDLLDYGYRRMEESGYAWPVVSMQVKYMRPLTLRQDARVEATLLEFENRMRIGFKIFDAEGACTTKGETIQMAYDMAAKRSLLVSPDCFLERVQSYLSTEEKHHAIHIEGGHGARDLGDAVAAGGRLRAGPSLPNASRP